MAVIAAPVATWVAGAFTAAGASGAVATAAGAVAATVAKGVVIGAVVGAASSAVQGGNILQGALKGAAVGGLTAGVMSGLGMATGMSTAGEQLAGYGLAQTPSGLAPIAEQTPEVVGLLSEGMTPVDQTFPTQTMVQEPTMSVGAPAPVSAGAPAVPAGASRPMSEETSRILAGVGQGAAQAYGAQSAAQAETEGARELAEFTEQQRRARIAANVPAEFQAQTANIQIPSWWSRYGNPQTGILATGGTNA